MIGQQHCSQETKNLRPSHIKKGRLYTFIDTMRRSYETHIVIALESEDVLTWKSEPSEYVEYDLVAILKYNTLEYAWVLDLFEED